MKLLTVEYIKEHSRIDFDCEDALLELYGDSAEETVASVLNRGKTVDAMITSLEEEYGQVPSAIIHAALMLVDVAYQQRSPVSPGNLSVVPYTFDMIVKPYMVFTY